MSTADQLLEEMFSHIKQKKRCAKELKKLARELETLRQKCNISECVGSTVGVVGAACLIGAGVATVLTGGAAAPLLGIAGGVCSGVGVGIPVVAKTTEHFVSSDTMKNAQKIDRKISETTEKIQKLLEKLMEEKQQVNSSRDPNDQDQQVMSEILKAMARRGGFTLEQQTKDPNPFVTTDINFGSGSDTVTFNLYPALIVGVVGIVAYMTLKGSGKKFYPLLAKGGKELIKGLSKTGLKTAFKGGAMAVGGAVVMALELPEAIEQWKDLIKNNHVTEASQSLRDAADALLRDSQSWEKQLNDIWSPMLMCFAIEKCEGKTVKKWLQQNSGSVAFRKLGELFNFLKKHISEEEKKDHDDKIDIIFLAHGSIRNSMIPACCLLPLSTIMDVVLYSPWNCTLSAEAAYGIAAGVIKPQHRVFTCKTKDDCPTPKEEHCPEKLPNHWNSMKKAAEQEIPHISLSPLNPKESLLNGFGSLTIRNRIFIPYVIPAEEETPRWQGGLSVPFFVVSLAFSLALLGSRFKATIHLASCLSDQSTGRKCDTEYLKHQYAYTVDDTVMTASPDMFKK